MFRISQYMQEIAAPTPLGPKRNPPGPVVIWNLIRRCNLTCNHCYSISADTNFPGELSTEQVYTVMDDLKGFKVPVLILSGGEPLLRPDIYDIAKRAKAKGFYVGLSSNGTLIDENNIDKIAECDFNYVGVSLDGIRETHDKFRRMDGAFEASLKGIRLCRDLGGSIMVLGSPQQRNLQPGVSYEQALQYAAEVLGELAALGHGDHAHELAPVAPHGRPIRVHRYGHRSGCAPR